MLLRLIFFQFQEGTTRVIFAYGKTDPADDDSIEYHGADQRGTKSLTLLSSSSEPVDPTGRVKYFDFFNQNVGPFHLYDHCKFKRHTPNDSYK